MLYIKRKYTIEKKTFITTNREDQHAIVMQVHAGVMAPVDSKNINPKRSTGLCKVKMCRIGLKASSAYACWRDFIEYCRPQLKKKLIKISAGRPTVTSRKFPRVIIKNIE